MMISGTAGLLHEEEDDEESVPGDRSSTGDIKTVNTCE